VLTLRVTLSDSRYDAPEKIAAYQRQALERLAAVPGVSAAGATSRLPWLGWGGRGSSHPLDVSGASGRSEDRPRTAIRTVSPGLREALRTPLIAGRDLAPTDALGGEPVALVSQALARRIEPGGDVLGRRVRLEHPRLGGVWRRVVGVCGDVTHSWWEPDPAPICYLPAGQAPSPSMVFAVRGDDPQALVPAIRAVFRELDPEQPVYSIEPLEQSIQDLFSPLKLSSSLMTIFGGLALLLAVIGIYGLVAYSVSQRTHEIGVRLALGASRASVLALVVGQGLRLAAVGLLIGAPVAWAMGRLAASRLFGVVAFDAPLLVALSVALLLVALLASWLPARHASRLDPMAALRTE
jgi:predicted permease